MLPSIEASILILKSLDFEKWQFQVNQKCSSLEDSPVWYWSVYDAQATANYTDRRCQMNRKKVTKADWHFPKSSLRQDLAFLWFIFWRFEIEPFFDRWFDWKKMFCNPIVWDGKTCDLERERERESERERERRKSERKKVKKNRFSENGRW